MKKILMFLSLVTACLMPLGVQATTNASNAQAQSQANMEQGRTYQGAAINGGVIDEAVTAAPEAWEKDLGNGYIQCCCYKPCYTYTCECEICPKYVERKCCRQVPQYYQVKRCRYVPEYYYETCCRQCTEEYCVTDCMQCPKYTYHKHCNWEPQYNYKCCPQPCAPECPPVCAPACQ